MLLGQKHNAERPQVLRHPIKALKCVLDLCAVSPEMAPVRTLNLHPLEKIIFLEVRSS